MLQAPNKFRKTNHAFAGRSARRRMNHGNQYWPYEIRTRARYPSWASRIQLRALDAIEHLKLALIFAMPALPGEIRDPPDQAGIVRRDPQRTPARRAARPAIRARAQSSCRPRSFFRG